MMYILTFHDSGYEIAGPVSDDYPVDPDSETFDSRTNAKTRADEWVTNNVTNA